MSHLTGPPQESSPSDAGATDSLFVIEDSLGYLVNRLARSFAKALSHQLSQYDVTVAQWAVLVFLWVEDGPTQRQLSRQVAIDDATMARTLDRMERDGLVRRDRNREDRRQINIFLTDRGRELRAPLMPLAARVNATATEGFSDEERDLVRDLLRRMIAALEPQPSSNNQES